MQICQMCILSTAHVTPESMKLIQDKEGSVIAMPTEHGALLYTYQFFGRSYAIPKDVLTVLKYAADRNADYVLLDSDENPLNDGSLPVYKQWENE